MTENARQILIGMVAQDPSLGDDARRCEAVLRDLCRNEHRAETKALAMAIQEQVVADLRAGTRGAPTEAFVNRLAVRLQDHCGLREGLARWAVDSWAIALDVISADGAPTAPIACGQTKGYARREAQRKARDRNGVERPSDAAEVNADGVWQETILAKGVRFELIWVPPGEFWMGAPDGENGFGDERPRHRMRLTRGLWMGKTPVTQGQWAALMGTNPSRFTQAGRNGPVEEVSWEDCQELAQAVRCAAGGGWRLPTEAEWEHACRAGSDTAWCFGSDGGKLTQYGWYAANAGGMTHPVARLKPNAWGLYDLHGNVWEWVQDWEGDYPAGGQMDSTGPSSGSSRCIRGGSWASFAYRCRSACRHGHGPGNSDGSLGVRLARVQP